MLNHTNYVIINNIKNNRNNHDNDNGNKNKCGINNVCQFPSNGHIVGDIIMVNVVIIWIFVTITFKPLFELELFESVLFEFILSNIYLWFIFRFISKHCILII